MMIHNALAVTFGNANEMRKMADTLDTVSGAMADIYANRTEIDKADIRNMMDAETWMDAQEAIAKGFADAQAKAPAKAKATTASFDLTVYNNVPETLKTGQKIVAEVSLQQRIDDVQEALDAKYPADSNDNSYYAGKYWVVEVYSASAIVSDVTFRGQPLAVHL